jgi:hypothetical protein
MDERRISAVRIKIERAERHLSDMQAEIFGFRSGKPNAYTVGTKRNPNTRQVIYYVRDIREMPLVIPAIVGDVTQNLRSALDYAVHQIFRAKYQGRISPEYFGFPVCLSASKYKSVGVRKIACLGQDVVDVISAVEPYKGSPNGIFSNGDLWCLHELNNISKHRLLLTVCTQYQMHSITPRIISELSERFPDEPTIDFLSSVSVHEELRKIPVKKGYVLYTAPPDCEVEKDMTFQFDVALNEPKVMEIYPVLAALQHFKELVDVIVRRLESFF